MPPAPTLVFLWVAIFQGGAQGILLAKTPVFPIHRSPSPADHEIGVGHVGEDEDPAEDCQDDHNSPGPAQAIKRSLQDCDHVLSPAVA